MKDRRKPPHAAAKSPKNSHTSPFQIELQKRRAEALEYRIQGYTYEQIGETMECSITTAFEYVDHSLKAITREPAENLMALELSRLDQLLTAFFTNAMGGDVNAAGVVQRVMERQSKLVGNDPATKFEHAGAGGSRLVGIDVKFFPAAPRPDEK